MIKIKQNEIDRNSCTLTERTKYYKNRLFCVLNPFESADSENIFPIQHARQVSSFPGHVTRICLCPNNGGLQRLWPLFPQTNKTFLYPCHFITLCMLKVYGILQICRSECATTGLQLILNLWQCVLLIFTYRQILPIKPNMSVL